MVLLAKMRLANVVRVADDPEHDPAVKGDPYKTLFVSRLSYEVKDTDLEREFGRFGPIERVRSSSYPIFLLHDNDHHANSLTTGTNYTRQRYRKA